MTESIAPFHLSERVAHFLTPSPTLHINERVNEMWAEGREVYHLGFGESRFPVHPRIHAALVANAHRKSYLSGQGLAELRGATARFYAGQLGRPIDADQVIIGPGSKSIIYAVQMAMEADLILPTPCWVSYAPQAHLMGKAVYHVPASADDGYELKLDALDATVRRAGGAQKMLLLTSPNNPTGQMYDPGFLADLADYCRRNHVMVLSDEIYALVPHGHRPHVSISRFYPEGTMMLSGISKHLSLGGWRLGIGILPAHDEATRLMHALRVIAGEIWSTPTGPVQYAAVSAYSNDPDIMAYIDECAHIHAIRTQYIWRKLVDLGIVCPQPDGGFYMFPNFDRWREPLAALNVRTSTALADYLLERYQLATLPATAFGTSAHDLSLRLASSYLDMENDARAQAVLDAYRADPDPDRFMEQHPQTRKALRRFAAMIDELGAA